MVLHQVQWSLFGRQLSARERTRDLVWFRFERDRIQGSANGARFTLALIWVNSTNCRCRIIMEQNFLENPFSVCVCVCLSRCFGWSDKFSLSTDAENQASNDKLRSLLLLES